VRQLRGPTSPFGALARLSIGLARTNLVPVLWAQGASQKECRVRALLFGLLTAVLVFNHETSPQKVILTGARLTWYGPFTFAKETEVDEPSAATGKKDILSGIVPPAVNTDRIPFTAGTWFGFGYELVGQPSNALVTLKYVTKIPAPGLRDSVTGQSKLVSVSNWPDLALSRTDLFRATSLGDLEGTPTGTWTLEVWYGERMLLEKSFIVANP